MSAVRAAPRPYVGRLAPSPTGALHLGNVRTFAIAWLRARAAGGRLVLRIEDLDHPRDKPGADREAVEEAFEKMGDRHSTADDRHPDVDCRVSNVKNKPPLLAGVDPAFVKLGEDQPEIVERINAAKPDVLFVALGNPKQELWMGRNKAKLDVGVMIGIGGTFNFLAGRVKRAPRWMQRCGLEWVYRISQEPGRLWRRYAYGLVKFSWLSLLHVLGKYRGV